VAARTLESAALAAVGLGLAAGVLGSAGLGLVLVLVLGSAGLGSAALGLGSAALGLGSVGPGSAGLAAVVLGLMLGLGRSVASNPSTLIAASAAIRSRDC
jgi:hypothetical protein